MLKINKIWLYITTALGAVVGVLLSVLSFKNKKLKDTKKQNEDLKNTLDLQNIAMNTMQKAKKDTEGKIEKMETGSSIGDFNASIDLLHNSTKRGL